MKKYKKLVVLLLIVGVILFFANQKDVSAEFCDISSPVVVCPIEP
jgi:hypothetical protein